MVGAQLKNSCALVAPLRPGKFYSSLDNGKPYLYLANLTNGEPNMKPHEFKQHRIDANLTQEQLADKLGCGARTIRNYENDTGALPERAVKMLKLVLKLK